MEVTASATPRGKFPIDAVGEAFAVISLGIGSSANLTGDSRRDRLLGLELGMALRVAETIGSYLDLTVPTTLR